MSEFFSYDHPVVITAKHTLYVHSPPMLTLHVLKQYPIVGIIRTCRFKNNRSDLRIRTYPDCELVTNIFEQWSYGAKAILKDDFLYIYEPYTGKAFSVDAESHTLELGYHYVDPYEEPDIFDPELAEHDQALADSWLPAEEWPK